MKLIKKILFVILLVIGIIASIFIVDGYNVYKEALKEINVETKVKTIKEDSSYTTIKDLPKDYLNAVVSVEDKRFYDHGAIDILSLMRALYKNVKEMGIVEGGSTITQQLAKNIYFTQEQTLRRKIAEIFMAFKLEDVLTKKEILELYVNTSYFGDGYYGIGEATEGYLNKKPSEMTISDSTLMAGIPNAPSAYAPTKNPDLAKKRQKIVINTMIENGYLTKEEADKIE